VEEAKAAFVTGLHVAVAAAALLHVALGTLALRWLSGSRTAPPLAPSMVEH
jgi:DHA2 family multidrug resistance protein-like MFS transporter